MCVGEMSALQNLAVSDWDYVSKILNGCETLKLSESESRLFANYKKMSCKFIMSVTIILS